MICLRRFSFNLKLVFFYEYKNILCTLEPDTTQNVILMHSTDEDQLKRCRAAFSREITKNEVDINLFNDIDSEQELEDFLATFDAESGVVLLRANGSG